MKSNVTFVTGLWNIDRGSAPQGFRREWDHYLNTFKTLLELDVNLIIYCDKEVESVVWEKRNHHNTFVIQRSKEFFKKGFDFFNRVQEIRNNESWKNSAGWLRDAPQSSLEYYNPIVMSKYFMLHDSCYINPFQTENFFWIDSGLSNTVNIKHFLNKENIEKISNYFTKLLFVCFPYDGKQEVHGFEKKKLNQLAGAETEFVARGGFFGGNSNSIRKLNSIYYDYLRSTLSDGFMGTEESIFTILCYKYGHEVDRVMINGNGLLGTFFENVVNDNIKIEKFESPQFIPKDIPINDLKIYVLTFNSPNQLKLLLENFEKTYPEILNLKDKVLINNSNQDTFDAEYELIARQHNFTVQKFNNIGICGARQWVAEDFEKCDSKYYSFFEDDMLFYEKGNSSFCKKGFSTYQENFFKKALSIVELEKFDFLKISYSEFFGDNSQQWSYCNIPQNVRTAHFGDLKLEFPRDYDKIPSVGVKKINSVDGLAYCEGDFYYCNWPIIFTKEGNRKIFLDTKWKHPYEQTWMSHCFQQQKKNIVKSGCLLLSPINHTRVFFYKAEVRREN